ncbi:SagB family peptide dehydrogenase [Thalassospira sp.]|uniref:SagB family peptide dehydrogenase n=1 Tax=Thalassospira sp. TaxID=1912094 RepID=UPI00273571B5|nr:SagB family peptide dehydrogenase [Thalassospira sp.]MDP2696965.1 SagB family peptide dehydrogenase [Thalassospira sp.]
MTFQTSEPFFGMMLSPLITGISYDGERAVLTVHFQGGTSNELPWSDAGLAELVGRMPETAGMSVPDLRRAVTDLDPGLSDGDVAKTTDVLLRRLTQNDMVRWWFGTTQQPLCFLDPRSRLFYPKFKPDPVPDGAVLSRFAFMRRDGDAVLLENPEYHAALRFTGAGQDLLPIAFARSASGTSSAFWHFLWCAGFLEHEATDTPSRQAWEFHDRVFHAGSRSFLGSARLGMNYRLKDNLASPPAQKPAMSDRKITLPRLRDSEDTPRSRPLNSVMETRRSIRLPGDFPLTLADLGVFLWRTVSVRGQMMGGEQELLKRPMPSGGSIHELEFYIAVHRCDGLEPGLYQYHGGDHALYALPANPPYVRAMLAGAAGGMGQAGDLPDCVIIMASRLLRLAWKYQGVAYRLSMLHVGVAMETFYLVAEDMGLSPCAVGGGDSALFAIATGLPEDEEAAIGEFVLNGRQVPVMAGGDSGPLQ